MVSLALYFMAVVTNPSRGRHFALIQSLAEAEVATFQAQGLGVALPREFDCESYYIYENGLVFSQ